MTKRKNNKHTSYIQQNWRKLLTVILGLCIVFGRVVIPLSVDINIGVVCVELLFEIIALAGAIFLNRKDIQKIIADTKKDKKTVILKKAFLLLVIDYIVTVIMRIFCVYVLKSDDIALVRVQEGMSDISTISIILVMISQVCLCPFSEELIFRKTIRDLIPNKVIYVIVSSLLFAFIHDWFFFSPGLLIYFVAGTVFALFYLKTGEKVQYTIAGHILINIIANIMTLCMS